MGGVVIKDSALILASDETLLKVEVSSASVTLGMVRRGAKAVDFLLADKLVRFLGACLASAYGLGTFNVEVVNKTTVNPDRIRVVKEGTEDDRMFINTRPEEFFYIANLIKNVISYSKVELQFLENTVRMEYDGDGLGVKLIDVNKNEGSMRLSGNELLKFHASLLACALGRATTPTVFEFLGKRLVVSERVEVHADLEQEVEIKGETKTLQEWIDHFIVLASKAGKNPSAVLRAFLKQKNIDFSNKVSLKVKHGTKQVQVLIPPHWALGVCEIFRL